MGFAKGSTHPTRCALRAGPSRASFSMVMPLWDDNNETLHDKMCGTRVVSTVPSAA